jgi:ubiquinone/menaquinone biosynthesis C-methylase UbiE
MRDPGFVQTFNRIAPRYDQRFGNACRPAQALCLTALADAVIGTTPESVLDIGCGTGVLLDEVRRRWPGADLIGVDPAAQMLAVAKERLPGARLLLGGAEKLPVADGTVGAVISTTSFGHWRDKWAAVREIHRVLRPGGTVCVVEHLPPSGLVRLLYQAARRLPDYWAAPAVRQLAIESGFGIVRCEPVNDFLLTVLRRPIEGSDRA